MTLTENQETIHTPSIEEEILKYIYDAFDRGLLEWNTYPIETREEMAEFKEKQKMILRNLARICKIPRLEFQQRFDIPYFFPEEIDEMVNLRYKHMKGEG